MDWAHPYYLAIVVPVAVALWWAQRRSVRSLSPSRQRGLLWVRGIGVALVLLALAGPAIRRGGDRQAVIFVMDHSQSQGETGLVAGYERVEKLVAGLPAGAYVGVVSAGQSCVVRRPPAPGAAALAPDQSLLEADGAQTDLAGAVSLAVGLFPPDASRRLVLVGDGQETRGDLEAAAADAALLGVVIDAVPVPGEKRPDVRVVQLAASKSRSHEGASFDLRADLESSLSGSGVLRLFENGIEVESRPVTLAEGEQLSVTFRRAPEERNLYSYRVRAEGFAGDSIHENDEALALVDVRGRPLLLYVEGETSEARYLADAMAKEGIRLQLRAVEAFPQSLQELVGYDGVVLSDIPAHKLGERAMAMIHDYVEKLGGGLVMIGGKNSFGVGGYYRTPIEDVLPVKMKAPDQEERYSTALALVLDRSGSMQGQKVEICKSAAIATVELLGAKDYVGVVAFDSSPRWVVPMTQATSKGTIAAQIATIDGNGGTNIYPAMATAREALNGVKAKAKHMIVLTDGQTEGGGYQELAAQIRAEGTTISTVGVGDGADVGLLQTIAAAGGGKFYETLDPTNLPRIFTQDAMLHAGRLIREESFTPRQVERHVMLKGCPLEQAPALLGYVKTNRKATAQVPLVTDLGDPLLAHWQFGLGKVTAFTSDGKSRWAALWISGWSGYSQFWAQLLRETARKSQGRFMDLAIEEKAQGAALTVDLLEDATRFKNDASVAADVYFVPPGAIGASMQLREHRDLLQTGPGRYEGRFTPSEPGVYLVRARAGAEVVSAGLVHNRSGEAATGRIHRPLLERVCQRTGGTLLDSPDDPLPPLAASQTRIVELTPLIVQILLLLFLADVAIRRWENLQGLWSLLRRRSS